MGKWLRFFLGTPQRFVTTMTVTGLVVVMMNPGLLRNAVERLVAELSPLLGPALTILIVLAGIRLAVSGWRRK